MQKILEFFKSVFIVTKWTIWYFVVLWIILKFIFNFDILAYENWWKNFYTASHGFTGFVLAVLVYSAIPLYIATVITTYRNKEYPIKISIFDKIFAKQEKKSETTDTPTPEQPEPEPDSSEQLPSDLPSELRVPYMRAKQHLSFLGATSVYNKQTTPTQTQNTQSETPESEIPIPTDFEIDEDFMHMDDSVPTFHDINFDIPIATEQELSNNTTKYLSQKKIEYETYHEFVASEKYLIYEHNDKDFWVMDGDSWFASGKQKDSPIAELKELAKQNGLTPVIYLASTNIMDINNTIKKFESDGVTVIKNLDELT